MPMPETNGDTRVSVKVLEARFVDCQQRAEDRRLGILSRLDNLEGDVTIVKAELTDHCQKEALRRARADTMRTIVVAVVAALASLGGAALGALSR